MLYEAIGKAAMLEQTAEEAAELAQACLKLARYERGENPVYKTQDQLSEDLLEEMADVMICIEELTNEGVMKLWLELREQEKKNRLKKRLKEWKNTGEKKHESIDT